MEKKSRLGRGLNSLLNSTNEINPPETTPDTRPTASAANASEAFMPSTDSEMFHVELSKIRVNPNQPRKLFDDASLARLADSMRVAGVIQPILVREAENGFEVIAGERRYRAAQMAALPTVPVILRKVDALEQSQLALIENIHREDLNPIDRAMAYREMAKTLNLTHAEIAARLGEERSGIANYIRLLDLPETSLALVRQGSVTVGHAKLLCGLENAAEIDRLAQLVVNRNLSVRALEVLIKTGDSPKPPAASAKASPHIVDLEQQISRDLQMRAEVKQGRKGSKGKLIIHYASLDQFDELMTRLAIKIE